MQTVIRAILSAQVATSGTFAVTYPTGKTRGDFITGIAHYFTALQAKFSEPVGASFSFGATSVTITYRGTTTLPAGTQVVVNLDEPGIENDTNGSVQVKPCPLRSIDLGSPVVAATTAVTTAQLFGATGSFSLDGTLLSASRIIFDVPRNVTLTAATTDHSSKTVTVTGKDVYGNVMVETITGPNANTVQGKKAFKEITGATVSAAVATNGISIGTGNILGLPVFLPAAGNILRELQDGATATAGTTVGGLATGTKSTATTADVRGTYLPNATPDGSKAFKLICAIEDPTFLGNPQFVS